METLAEDSGGEPGLPASLPRFSSQALCPPVQKLDTKLNAVVWCSR
jgi:hypothetical protein